MTEPEVLVIVHDSDRIKEWRYANDEEGSLSDQNREGPLPEEFMAKLEKHLGDAGAQVTVSADLTTSVDYGNKAGAFVSIKVTCNNDEKDIMAVHDIARDMAEQLVSNNQARMETLLAGARGLATPQSAVPAKAQGQTKVGRIKLGGAKTPDFRR